MTRGRTRRRAPSAEHGFAFFFAPKYHPAFRHIIPARKLCAQRGQSDDLQLPWPAAEPRAPHRHPRGSAAPRPLRTVRPRPSVPRPAPRHGRLRRRAGRGRAPFATWMNCPLSAPPPSPSSTRSAAWPAPRCRPRSFPLQAATLHDLRGGDARTNAAIIRRVLAGEERGPKRDVVLLNAAAALFVANRAGQPPGRMGPGRPRPLTADRPAQTPGTDRRFNARIQPANTSIPPGGLKTKGASAALAPEKARFFHIPN